MTGPEHYREAERLLAEADNIAEQGGDMGEMIAAAQVHATLAQAAATAGHMAVTAYIGECSGLDVEEWAGALALSDGAADEH
ncbi:hypothetical protein [Streptomyces sp. NEAU-174]|uniref:hypothetical protein n=1 Tax=Streptomyces sp. NEAU-174 TaxID=3458254 RepID=UPI00404516B7